MPMTTAITGMVVDTMPNPIPDMMTVAGPVFPLSANSWVGR